LQGFYFCFRIAQIRSEDARKFLHFHVYCARHNCKLQSLGDVALHRQQNKENKHNVKFVCGCCGRIFRKMEEISAHINTVGFYTKYSSIANYNKTNFDVQAHVAEVEATIMLREAAEEAKRQAAADRRQIAAAATPVLERLQGEQQQYATIGAHIPLCCLLSASLSTAQPVTAAAGRSPAPVSSIYVLQSTVMSTGTAAAATSTQALTTPVSATEPRVLAGPQGPQTSASPPQDPTPGTAKDVVYVHTAAPQGEERQQITVTSEIAPPAQIPGDVDPSLPSASNRSTPLSEADRQAISDLLTFAQTSTAMTTTVDAPQYNVLHAPPVASAFEWL